jgi:hypothetical protein
LLSGVLLIAPAIIMARIHLFELEDQPWFPDVFRKGITDYLEYASNRMDLYKVAIPVINKGVEKSGTNNIIDLCSGAGGGMKKINQKLKNSSNEIKITLTDKFPNLQAFKKAAGESEGNIDFVSSPVDASNVPAGLKGFRTQFVSFHHFKPDFAFNILKNAADSKSAIGIFEVTERKLINFIAMLFTPVVVMLAMPFIKPFSLSRLFFTYIIPVIPFATMWDGMVSVLRTYSIKEMQAMTSKINADNYQWEVGRLKVKAGPDIIYLLGYPEEAAAMKQAA